MRPLKKWAVGHGYAPNNFVQNQYNPYGNAFPILNENMGDHCAYCEVFSPNLKIEHVISKDQDNTKTYLWDNFLLSCDSCNGRDNKTNKSVDLNKIYMPHINNTQLAFNYLEGGLVSINNSLLDAQKEKANALIDLVGLDKYPGNPKFPPDDKRPNGINPRDKRWEHRRKAWEIATIKLNEYLSSSINPSAIAEYAVERGFFSIWFTVFKLHPEVKKALVEKFTGTDANCFDENMNPIPRNPDNPIDNL
ncbi:MAG: HNH endonuclease [Marinilabiliaceae bacterium]|nr:HNH endonuclease [Marinilabiliaceae bacterium]